MIYVTGDIHGGFDIHKLSSRRFPAQKSLTKSDYIVICGDFGLVWNDGDDELYWRGWLNDKPWTTLFVDGNHEDHDLLKRYPVESWNGGKVHFISDSIIHLTRGQVFDMDGVSIFTMGGATSIDKAYRTPGKSWWPEEVPSHDECEEAIENLVKHDCTVDYIITHECSQSVFEKMSGFADKDCYRGWLEGIDESIRFKRWFFGHHHLDVRVDDKHRCLYQDIELIERTM